MVYILYLRFSLPLATGKREAGQHTEEKTDHMLGEGAKHYISLQRGQAKLLGGQLPPSEYVKRGPGLVDICVGPCENIFEMSPIFTYEAGSQHH